nr:transmembrane 9 superfamily member 2-like [Aotus nancymaae]
MSISVFRVGTNFGRQWPGLPGLRWLLGLGLLLRLQAVCCTAFYLPGLAAVNLCQAEREIAFCQVSFNKTEMCKSLCKILNGDQMNKLAFLKKGIRLNYQHHWSGRKLKR